MSFAEHLATYDHAAVHLSIYSKTTVDVERALAKDKLDLDDFQALISPAAEAYLEPMAQRSMRLTQQRFGKTQQFYIPLYLSNMCSNVCQYCGFSMGNKIRRLTLDMAQIDAELDAIKALGFDHILLVTGESERKVGMAYFRQVMPLIKARFSHVSMEVQPLDEADYRELIPLGLDAVMVYQETYNRQRYAEVHPKGRKRDFDYRLATPERLGAAGVRKIGIGALIGLDQWRNDCFYAAAHLQYLERRYWQSKFSISFPRLRPCEGGFQPVSVMTDKQLVQLICAYRLFNPDVELSLSTRESEHFRNHAIPLGITTMSAFSSTQPGGYAKTSQTALEQFEISDERRPEVVAAAVQKAGYQVVWKDWDRVLG
ncbi:2-iminoacetate synthase ThiH [Agarivorans sp. QJM3NY_29]|uniref:2-iminoacetate synthase ThiH n=1 Tax=unclassified Agarivorans TaxID=2636026 RepID=UPI003D7D8754